MNQVDRIAQVIEGFRGLGYAIVGPYFWGDPSPDQTRAVAVNGEGQQFHAVVDGHDEKRAIQALGRQVLEHEARLHPLRGLVKRWRLACRLGAV